MIELELDGKPVQVPEGSMLMHAAEKIGTYIPHFCYHKKLSIAANCRMCLVDVEKMPKPMPACATPASNGMVVRTRSEKAMGAQQSVMEFLLINHPLDCPICDQGGECQLQDLAVGYGKSCSRYAEEKRVVLHKNVGPLISMAEMSRCIHCTRCVRFGQEVAGVMELGMVNRGEHSEITTVLGATVDSELSGNMIDICPVGALTSKPFRYSARTWELSRRKSIAPHDSTGTNIIVQVKNHRVMRVVPLENEAVNECWIADRDRFSYEALNSDERLTTPMIKQGGQWHAVDWKTALDYIVHGLKSIQAEHGAHSIGALVSPHSTLQELYLAAQLVRGLGSDNIDYRLRHADFSQSPAHGIRWLGMPIAALSQLQAALVVGSNLRKDHPLFAQRVRQAVKRGGAVFAINECVRDWAMPMTTLVTEAAHWARQLARIAAAVARVQGVAAPLALASEAPDAGEDQGVKAIAAALLQGERKAILLGNAAAHHAQASLLLALAHWIGEHTGATVGYLSEAANTVGAQWMQAQPLNAGLHAAQMLSSETAPLKAALLLHTEPEFDCAAGARAAQALAQAEMVVTLNAFKANMAFSDVLLPVAPFTETAGSFVNAEARVQSFHAVVKPLGETRPAWKVLRVLCNLLDVPGVDYDSAQQVLAAATAGASSVPAELLGNTAPLPERLPAADHVPAPVSASIYQLDGLVRRAAALQQTADARTAHDAARCEIAQQALEKQQEEGAAA